MQGFLNAFVVVLLIVLCFFNLTPETIFFANDQATDFLIADLQLAGDFVLLGPPSHIGGRHPGPLYYWYVTTLYALSGKSVLITTYLFVVTKLLSLWLIFLILRKLLPGVNKQHCLFAILVVALGAKFLELFRMQWQSHFLILSSSIAFLCTLTFAQYRWKALGLLFFGLTFLFHSHLSSSPVVLGLFLAALASLCFAKKSFADRKVNPWLFQYLPLLAGSVLWLSVVYHELAYHSNFLNVFNLHSDASTEKAGLFVALSVLLEFFSKFLLHSRASLVSYTAYQVVFYLVFLAILFVAFFKLLKNNFSKVLVFVLPVCVAVFAVSMFRPPIYIHYYNSLVLLPLLFFALSIASLTNYLKGRPLVLALLPSLLLVFQVFSNFRDSWIRYSKSPYPEYHTLAHAEELAELIQKDAKADFKLFTRTASIYMTNSYYNFTSHKDYSSMEYQNFFHEVDAFQKKSKVEHAYAIFCPAPYNRHRKADISNLPGNWKEERLLNLSSCESCRECAVSVLKN